MLFSGITISNTTLYNQWFPQSFTVQYLAVGGGGQGSNPFAAEQVKALIRRDLDPVYLGQYKIILVPNIVNITYGRDVGYRIEQESFDEATHAISATKIRREMGLE